MFVRAGAFGGNWPRRQLRGEGLRERGGESEGVDTKTVTRISFFKLSFLGEEHVKNKKQHIHWPKSVASQSITKEISMECVTPILPVQHQFLGHRGHFHD